MQPEAEIRASDRDDETASAHAGLSYDQPDGADDMPEDDDRPRALPPTPPQYSGPPSGQQQYARPSQQGHSGPPRSGPQPESGYGPQSGGNGQQNAGVLGDVESGTNGSGTGAIPTPGVANQTAGDTTPYSSVTNGTSASSGRELPFTGSDAPLTALIGAGALAAGIALRRRTRGAVR